MGTKVAASGFQWSQPLVPNSSCSSPSCQALSSSSSSSAFRRTKKIKHLSSLSFRMVWSIHLEFTPSVDRLRRSPSLGRCSKTRTGDIPIWNSHRASFNCFPVEDDDFDVEAAEEIFTKRHEDLVLRLQSSDEYHMVTGNTTIYDEMCTSRVSVSTMKSIPFPESDIETLLPQSLGIQPEPPDWPERKAIIPVIIEKKANSVDLPVSLRMIKRKKQWQEGFRDTGESALCSVKKAFSSMVFMVRELQSFSLYLREILFYEDLRGILARVQDEMNASFVWLFQQVFSHTPTFMVYIMILLANFTVYSMGQSTAMPTPFLPGSCTNSSIVESKNHHPKFDSSSVKTFLISSSIRGNDGGGKVRPVAGGMDGGDGHSGRWYADLSGPVIHDENSLISSIGKTAMDEQGRMQKEIKKWNQMLEQVSEMQAWMKNEGLDQEMKRSLVAPVTVNMELEDKVVYFRTELLYKRALSQEPNNTLLLCNFAQFLYLVIHDHDRAEQYFKRAIGITPPDAESLNKYATFLWLVRKDVCAAEEVYLQAIEADPSNTYYSGNYAHFLWNTGGEDTCFPLDGSVFA